MDRTREEARAARIEVRGLSLRTHHGVSDAEQEIGQRLVFDVAIDLADCAARETDSVADTVDYGAVCELVAGAATASRCRTLERLVQVVAERLLERFECERARVRAAKPEPPLAFALDEVAVEVELAAG